MLKKYLILIVTLLLFLGTATTTIGDAADLNPGNNAADINNSSTLEDDYDDEYDDDDVNDEDAIGDPLFYWNYSMYVFNDRFYYFALDSAARGFAKIVPEKGRVSIRNFFKNLTMPVRVVNGLLQGKVNYAGNQLNIFIINTTLGVVGFRDAAGKYYPGKQSVEDFGQTLGNYGLGHGFYLTWPFLGPSTLRDSIGLVGDYFLTPTNYLSSGWRIGSKAAWSLNNTSLNLGEYERLKESAFNHYDSIQDVYIQYRNEKVKH